MEGRYSETKGYQGRYRGAKENWGDTRRYRGIKGNQREIKADTGRRFEEMQGAQGR